MFKHAKNHHVFTWFGCYAAILVLIGFWGLNELTKLTSQLG